MTMRCSRCDIAHEETSRCPTDLEYERGYRNGMNQKAKELEPIKRQLEAAYAHERQTHARLSAILGTDDSLEKCAERLAGHFATLAAALARIALSETGEQCASDFAQDCLKWKSTSELWDIIKAAEGGRDDRLCEATE